mmetsp:Transcript_124/g.226  ORF Transcript_124/g.226 Transcript_124/m.226 type:complete len:151 (-) Transcript_124:1303-1755(-)
MALDRRKKSGSIGCARVLRPPNMSFLSSYLLSLGDDEVALSDFGEEDPELSYDTGVGGGATVFIWNGRIDAIAICSLSVKDITDCGLDGGQGHDFKLVALLRIDGEGGGVAGNICFEFADTYMVLGIKPTPAPSSSCTASASPSYSTAQL